MGTRQNMEGQLKHQLEELDFQRPIILRLKLEALLSAENTATDESGFKLKNDHKHDLMVIERRVAKRQQSEVQNTRTTTVIAATHLR
jgi:hypothetical protein